MEGSSSCTFWTSIHKQGRIDLHAPGDTIAHISTHAYSHDELPTIPKAPYIGSVGTYPIMYHAFAPEQAHADNRLQSTHVDVAEEHPNRRVLDTRAKSTHTRLLGVARHALCASPTAGSSLTRRILTGQA